MGFSANSLLTRAAVGPHLIDAVTSPACGCWPGPSPLALVCTFELTAPEARAFHTVPWAGAAALAGYAYAFAFAYTRIDAGTGALVLFGAVQLTMTGWGIARGERPRRSGWGCSSPSRAW